MPSWCCNGWITIWESGQELYSLKRCKVEQYDALQHNGMTNTEMEICNWKGFWELRLCFSWRWEVHHTKRSEIIKARLSAEIIRVLPCRSRQELVKAIACTLDTVYRFQFQKPFPTTATNSAGHICIQFSFIRLRIWNHFQLHWRQFWI